MKLDKGLLLTSGLVMVFIGLFPFMTEGNTFLLNIMYGPGLVLLAVALSIEKESK